MKKILLFFILFLFSINITLAYKPTPDEVKSLNYLKVLFEKQANKK